MFFSYQGISVGQLIWAALYVPVPVFAHSFTYSVVARLAGRTQECMFLCTCSTVCAQICVHAKGHCWCQASYLSNGLTGLQLESCVLICVLQTLPVTNLAFQLLDSGFCFTVLVLHCLFFADLGLLCDFTIASDFA